MGKFRYRLLFVLFIIVFIVLTGLGLTVGQLLKKDYFEQMVDRIKKEAELASFQIVEELDHSKKVQEISEHMSQILKVRITVIAVDGTVIAETAARKTLLDNHLHLPEIQAVQKREDRYFIRYNDTLEKEFIYYAVPLIDEKEQISGFLRIAIPMETIDSMIQKWQAILFVSFLLAFFVIVFLIYHFVNQMTIPIEKAKKVANELATGNYKVRVEKIGNDDISELLGSLDLIADQIERLTNRHQLQQMRMKTLIEHMGSGLMFINTRGDLSLINPACKHIFQENTDEWINRLYHEVIKEKEVVQFIQNLFMTEKPERREVMISNDHEVQYFDVYGAPIISADKLRGIVLVFHDITELKKFVQVRKDFVANVSHELRTPVTSIRGFSETLLDGAMEDAELRKKFLSIIFKESERLQNLIHDLLELSRLEQNDFQLHLQPTDFKELVKDVIELLKNKADEKEITITSHFSGDTIFLADSMRIKQVIINLINNGIMYTPPKGKVHVKVNALEDKLIIVVSDTGIGISEHELPRIFERFYRIDRARSRNSGGTGLGLAIVKHIVEVHQGHIDVQSEFGEGTTFTITLPKI